MEMGIAGIIKFLASLAFVLALMGGLALVLKKLGLSNPGIAGRGDKRMKLIEVLPLDARRKAVILECDGEQHLVLLSPAGDTVVKNNLSKRVVSNESIFKDAA